MPASTSNSSSWPWPSSATTPRTSPGWRIETRIDQLGRGGEVLHAQTRRAAGLRGGAVSAARWPRSIRAPSIISTTRSSMPGAMSTSPTLRPSRRTVATVAKRGDLGEAVGDVDDAAARSSACCRATRSTRSTRSVGAALRSVRPEAARLACWRSARARSMMRSVASGRSRIIRVEPELGMAELGGPSGGTCRHSCRRGAGCPRCPDPGSARVPGRIDRHEARAPRLGGRAHARLRAPDRHATLVGADRAGEDLHEGGICPHRSRPSARPTSPRRDGQARIGQRAHGAKALGHVLRIQKRVRHAAGHGIGLGGHAVTARLSACSKGAAPAPSTGTGAAGEDADQPSPGPSQAMICSMV